MNPGDWDRLFAPNAPRRGGPLRALMYVLLVGILMALLGGGTIYGLNMRQQQQAIASATATAFAETVAPQLTATASAEQTAQALATPTAPAETAQTPTASPAPGLGAGQVVNGGNLRSEARIAPETVIGLIYPGDAITFLEQQSVDGQLWLRIRVDQPAPNRSGEGVPAGTEGWASSVLLSPLP